MANEGALMYQSSSKSVQFITALKLLGWLPIKEGDYVLDVGCGTGNLSQVISEKVGSNGKVLGIDPDSSRIEAARALCSEFKNVEFHVCKSCDMPLPEKPFNHAVSMFVLHWMPSEEKYRTLELIYESIAEGGMLAAAITPRLPVGNFELFFEIYSEKVKDFKERLADTLKTRTHFETIAWYQENLAKVGFEILSIEEVSLRWNMGSWENFLNWIVSTFSGTFIGEFDLKEISKQIDVDDVEWDRYDDGGLSLTGQRIEVLVRKPLLSSSKSIDTVVD